jgi:hypothetical protein
MKSVGEFVTCLVTCGVALVMLAGFGLMVSGYITFFQQALRSGRKRERLKWLWDWQGNKQDSDRLGLRLIFIGASIGAVIFTGAAFWLLLPK